MSTTETAPAVDPALADAREVLRIVGEGQRVTDPELIERVHREAMRIRRRVFEEHGLLDVAVPAIRELRES